MDQYEGYIASGFNSFDQFALSVADKLEHTALKAKQKADEAGVTSALQGTASSLQSNLSYYGSAAAELTKETVNNLQASAQDGTLLIKTTETTKNAANKAQAYLGAVGYSLFQRVKEYSGSEQPRSDVINQHNLPEDPVIEESKDDGHAPAISKLN